MGYRYSAFDQEFATERKSTQQIEELIKIFSALDEKKIATPEDADAIEAEKLEYIKAVGEEIRRLAHNGEVAARYSQGLAIRARQFAINAVSEFKKLKIA